MLRGAVQGVGFRPFVYRLASELGLSGWVCNSAQGLFVEAEGPSPQLEQLRRRVEAEKPPRSYIQSVEAWWLDPAGYSGFQIRESADEGAKTVLVQPDSATCPDCLVEIFSPENRRYFYPFTNCTHCGPRFSIIEKLPYDRANTSMRRFKMCARCQAEYDNPNDRRFHAQPNACADCGPQLELWNRAGEVLTSGGTALEQAADAIRVGKIVAVKGLGGFHLMVAAHHESAVQRLRELKHREEKPFALMFPSLESIRGCCEVSEVEERILRSAEAPIVLLRRKSNPQLSTLNSQPCSAIAPGNPNLGVMLPYTPLHHLLMHLLGFPVVATSGNLSDEPICIDERDALQRLGGIADLFLVHNRPIVRHVDDSIVRVMAGRELVLRRARGFAPLPIPLKQAVPSILAVGAHLKNTVALANGGNVFISQHIGDLETEQAYAAFQRTVADLPNLYEAAPEEFAADVHPDYLSTKFAAGSGKKVTHVQHHYAHVLACMAENEVEPPVLGVSWDGTGYGPDGTIWGGEFLLVTKAGFERVATLRPFPLPGGDTAAREPRRAALGLFHAMFSDAELDAPDLPPLKAFSAMELANVRQMLRRGVNSPLTSSAGRLFDAVAAMIGLRQRCAFEGQAAMELEWLAERAASEGSYSVEIKKEKRLPQTVDWEPLIRGILRDLKSGVATKIIAARFHNTLAEAILGVAQVVGEQQIALSGGCFQNRYLTEKTIAVLRQAGFRVYWHQRVPPNDGGIALGQTVAATRQRT